MNHLARAGKRRVRIALTMGDPAGVGPELVVRVATQGYFREEAEIIIYGSRDIIAAAAARFAPDSSLPMVCEVVNLKFSAIAPGQATAACGSAARDTIIAATRDALAGKVDAIVTAPVNKAAVNLAGIAFTGHTELIAELCHCSEYAMMQSAGKLRVAFVTTHIPLRQVVENITAPRIITVANLLEQAIRAEGISRPALAIAAINPHAGEDGYMGSEDEEVVKPATARLQQAGCNVTGPFPPDTLFIASTLDKFDGVVAMYHDQGHIPFKMLAFDRGVNSTLGLPIIRTSVDHGTAFPIAWQGIADSGSLEAALRLAIVRARNRI